MSRWMVIGAVILALALAALVFLPRGSSTKVSTNAGNPIPGNAEPILMMSPAAVDEIQITWGDTTQRLVRGPLPDTWLREWTDSSGTLRRWPVAPTRVRGGIRLLHESLVSFDAPPLNPSEVSGTLVFKSGGQSESLLLTASSLDGRRHATHVSARGPRGCLLPDQIATLFDRAAVGEWLERGIFPGLATPVGSVTLTHNNQSIQLGRVANSWSLRAPFVSTVETARMNDILLALETFTISRVTETLQAPTTEPTAVIQADVNRPIIDGESTHRTVVRYLLRSWPATDDRTREVPARASVELVDLANDQITTLWGPVDGVISIESVAAAIPPLTDLLGRRCLDVVAADITELQFGNAAAFHTFKSGGRWTTSTAPLVGAENDALTQLLKLLCDERADSVKVVEIEPQESGTSVALTSEGGRRMELRLRLVNSEGKPGTQVLFVRTPRVDRGYDLSQRPVLRAWLVGLLPV